VDWREMVQGVRDTAQQIKQSQPFETHQLEAQNGQLGYRQLKFGQRLIWGIVITFCSLLFLEVKWHYDENMDYMATEKDVHARNYGGRKDK
jgi:hypothetical protein